MATSLTLGASGADVNPLLVESTAPHGAPQFTQITNEHYKPVRSYPMAVSFFFHSSISNPASFSTVSTWF